jgi:hypothetical protein
MPMPMPIPIHSHITMLITSEPDMSRPLERKGNHILSPSSTKKASGQVARKDCEKFLMSSHIGFYVGVPHFKDCLELHCVFL